MDDMNDETQDVAGLTWEEPVRSATRNYALTDDQVALIRVGLGLLLSQSRIYLHDGREVTEPILRIGEVAQVLRVPARHAATSTGGAVGGVYR